MPLRDHFSAPLGRFNSWQSFYSQWAPEIVRYLHGILPAKYHAGPRVNRGLRKDFAFEAVEFEVRIYRDEGTHPLVSTIQLVAPANKDCSAQKQAFVDKCRALLRKGVSVTIVDITTSKDGNLFRELCLAIRRTAMVKEIVGPYAVSLRTVRCDSRNQLQAWEEPLAVGERLPTLPLWLTDTMSLPFDIEVSYEETSRIFKIR